jgi:hypothetical protein
MKMKTTIQKETKMMNNDKHPVEQIAEACGGTITSAGILPDGSGFATMSMPLRKDHWIYDKGPEVNVPPMVFKVGDSEHIVVSVFPQDAVKQPHLRMTKQEFADRIKEAGRYAVRCATMNGADMDFDPDALLQNLVVGMTGYWTADGLTSTEDDWANPPQYRKR